MSDPEVLGACRICAGGVINEDCWVELEGLGRFWLCRAHFDDASFIESKEVGWLYLSMFTPMRLVLGPYPYR